MGRKSTIDRLPPPARDHLMRLLRDNRLTLDEMLSDLSRAYPDLVEVPSRSAVHRYSQGVEEIVAHEREMAAAANALVAELGDEFDSRSGALLAQAVTTLASRTAMGRIKAGDVMEIGDVLDLARAAKAAQEARSLNLRERQAVAKAAREKLLEEQRAKLDKLGKSGAITQDALAAVIRAAYDL